jgi:hypothetical protein
LTAADTLNGIEWKGTLTISVSAMREFAHRGQFSALHKEDAWSEWSDSSGMNAFAPKIFLIKQRGQWEVKSPFQLKDRRNQNVSAPDCATIPQ